MGTPEDKHNIMILLETGSRILEEVIRQRVQSDKREAVDITLADFDGVQYHIATNATQRNLVTVSISWPCISQMKQFGTDAKVQSFYGPLVTSAENGYDYTLQFDLDNLADKDSLPARSPCSSAPWWLPPSRPCSTASRV